MVPIKAWQQLLAERSIMNPHDLDPNKDYQLTGGQLLRLVGVAKRLYLPDRLTGDEMRDLAQIIFEGVLPSAEQVD